MSNEDNGSVSTKTKPKSGNGGVSALIALASQLIRVLGGSKGNDAIDSPARPTSGERPVGDQPADPTNGGKGGGTGGKSIPAAERSPSSGQWFKEHSRLFLFLAAMLLTAVFARLATVPDAPTTPGGMLALEFPGNRSGALAALSLLDQGGAHGRSVVTEALWWDFGLILSYSLALWLATQWAVKRRFSRTSGEPYSAPRMVDLFAIIAPIAAGVFDVLENVSLFALLNWSKGEPLAGLLASATTVFACAKFTLLVFVAVYLARSFIVIGWRAHAWPNKEETGVPEPKRRVP